MGLMLLTNVEFDLYLAYDTNPILFCIGLFMYEWRTGRGCVYKNHVHIVFVTKYRRGVLTKAMLNQLHEIFTETCAQMDCEISVRLLMLWLLVNKYPLCPHLV